MLPCSFQTTAALNRLNIIWTVSPLRQPKHPLQVITYEQGRIVESLSEYFGRVSFAHPPTRDASIFINHTRVTDTGTYHCTVLNPPDGATPNIGLVGLTVLVPPSSPECSSEGERTGRIHLRCSVREGIPTPRFQWEKISPDGHQLVTSQEDYQGSATLTNLTSGISGLYRCTATNLLGSPSCAVDIQLHVGGMNPLGIFAAVSITLIMGLVLLALCSLVLCLHQQTRRRWHKAELPAPPTRMDNVPAGPLPVPRSPGGDTTACSDAARPVWRSHMVYSARHSQLCWTSSRLQPPEDNGSLTDSEGDDLRPAPSSLYSINSGFLV